MGSWNGIDTLAAGAYPKAGQLEVITRFLAAAPELVYRRKTANETVNNTSTLQDDDHIFWPVSASGVYALDLSLFYTSGTTPDFKLGFSGPTGTTMVWGGVASDTAGAITIVGNYSIASTPGIAGSGTDLFARFSGVVTVGSVDGTFKLQWAQNTANASNTTLYAGSHASLTRIA